MGVSCLTLNSAVMSVSRTSGMTGMKVSNPAPTTVTLVTEGWFVIPAGGAVRVVVARDPGPELWLRVACAMVLAVYP